MGIHIFNKQAVSHRLASAARHVVYGEETLVYSGPRVVSVKATAASIVVTYGVGTEGGGLALRSTFGFETCSVSCTDTNATWSAAKVISNTESTISLAAPSGVTSLRYAHIDAPSQFTGNQLAVYNKEGLPATPGFYNVTGAVSVPGVDLSVPTWTLSSQNVNLGAVDLSSWEQRAKPAALLV